MLLDLAHLQRHRGALVQERDQLRVDRIDAIAQRFQAEFSSSSMRFAVLFEQRRRQAPRCSKSFMYSTSAFTPSSGTAL